MPRDITDSDSSPTRRGRRVATLVAAAAVLALAATIYLLPSLARPGLPAAAPLPRSQGLLAADFPDYAAGWLLTQANGVDGPGRLWRTIDGGATWKPAASAIRATDIEQFHFFDDSNGYLLELSRANSLDPNRLLVTADGGARWTEIGFPKPPGLELYGLSMLDSRHGRALFTQPRFGGDFLRTTAALYAMDDGSRWAKAGSLEFNGTDPNWTFGAIKGPMTFADPLHGLIPTQTPTVPVGAYITSDGGQTWTLHQFSAPPGGLQLFPGAVTAATFGQTELIGLAYRFGIQPGTPSGSAYVYRSDDFGRTWSDPIEAATSTGDAAPRFVTPAVWWVADGRAVLLTTDAGRTWLSSSLRLPGATNVKALYPLDDRRAWAFAGGASGAPTLLYETSDGAADWTLKTPPG